jgi:chaperonin GroEL
VQIVRRVLEEPLRRIAGNAGVEGSMVIDKVSSGTGSFGFNAQGEEYGDLVQGGVIDPTKVVRTALQNAASVASLMLITEALTTDKLEKKKGGVDMPLEMPDMEI